MRKVTAALAAATALALTAALALGLALGGAAQAHHSFAVFFDAEGSVAATGVVTEFNFRNPHASITIEVPGEDGEPVVWKGETNAQTLMRRRGWTADSIQVGETVTLEGWPSRDGSPYMRIRQVVRADGTVVGRPVGFTDD
jgi:hypothetical protein